MKVVHYSNSGNLGLIEWPDPVPGSGEVLVKVKATALNRADLLQVKGLYPPPPGESEILGLEIAGEVAAIGSEVTRWKKGDRVCALLAGGGYAQFAVVHEDLLMAIPDKLNFEEAAAIPEVFLTATQVLVLLAAIKSGDHVLIHAGASGVGTAAIQMVCKLGGKCMVTASAGKRDICLQLGAELVVDYNTEDFEAEALKWTKGKGVNIIVDPIGGSYFNKNLRSLHTDGMLIQLAFMGGAKVDEIDLSLILFKRLRITGSTLRARSLDYKAALVARFKKDILPLFDTGQLQPVIDRIYDWSDANEAHQYMESNRSQGKIILRVQD